MKHSTKPLRLRAPLRRPRRSGQAPQRIGVALTVAFAAVVLLPAVFSFVSSQATVQNAEAASTVEIWWPADNAHVSGVQPFKALLKGDTVERYEMFWQVDGDHLNPMHSDYRD